MFLMSLSKKIQAKRQAKIKAEKIVNFQNKIKNYENNLKCTLHRRKSHSFSIRFIFYLYFL